ncbi:MAG TPA: phosphoribosylglycinamide formyltransferase [Clostridia bacterium]|jgi:phosphoribosylglycinamide formyltransferase-1|nr:phosphoribosylglycinamide formyltransferase [Clostridia bacterium]
MRLAVLASGRGSNLQAILDACRQGKIKAQVVLVVSDQCKAFALKRAEREKIPAVCLLPEDFSAVKAYEKKLLTIIKDYQVDCLLLAGFMRILSAEFMEKVAIPVLNIHPSLLPAFPGLRAQKQALDYGVRYSGCTVHFVDAGVDTGPIILQAVVPVYPDDSEESLAARILREEHRLYPRAVQLLVEGKIYCKGRQVLFSEED